MWRMYVECTVEETSEALIRVIAEACNASMPRRPKNENRKIVYWWNEELVG